MRSAVLSRLAALLLTGILVAGCQPDEIGYGPKHQRPLSMQIRGKMTDLDMTMYSPILLRIFKEESTLEVWKRKRNGKFALLKSYEICKWSGKLGPKVKEGDRQAPEGFYEIYPAQMNPNSSYHLSFNLGFPNPYDRAHGRTGSHLMVHGACSSRGCYAMEDAQIQEIYSLARDSFKGGQRAFQVQAFPFRMTPENMARHVGDKHMEFWSMLKEGYDHFEVTKRPPSVNYCGKRYVFNAVSENESLSFNARAACPTYRVPDSIAVAVASKQKSDAAETEKIIAELAEKRRRDEEWKNQQTMIAEALGAKKKDGETTVAGIDGVTPKSAGGAPVPRPSPRSALALVEEKEPDGGSFFGSLFGDEPANSDPKPETDVAATETPAKKTAASGPTPPADIPADEPAGDTGEAVNGTTDDESSVFSRWFGIGDKQEEAAAPADAEPQS